MRRGNLAEEMSESWYFAQVETKEAENVCQGLILLHHMERRGPNQLVWARRRIS